MRTCAVSLCVSASERLVMAGVEREREREGGAERGREKERGEGETELE